MKTLLRLLFFFFSFSTLFAQTDKSDYALLWEISGQQLKKPSYLFGTMHVRDERAFEFSDSVLISLDQADAFAMEINPQDVIDFTFDMLINPDTTNTLKDKLSEAAYRDLAEAFFKETGQSLDSMENKDPMAILLMLSDMDEPDYTTKRKEVVDLFLYKQAYNQGKELFGLERMEDYTNMTNSFFDMFEKGSYPDGETGEEETAKVFEQMIEVYQQGDLKSMESLIDQFGTDEEYGYEMLNRRNFKMVDQIIPLIQDQSLFCAVGTAHLFGKDGMITLLRNKGYQVRRVIPTFTGVAQNYVEKTAERTWVPYQDTMRGIKMAFPAAPRDLFIKQPELKSSIDFQISIHVTGSDFFSFIRSNILINDGSDTDSLYIRALNQWQNGEETTLIDFQQLNKNGFPGRQLTVVSEDQDTSVWQLYAKEGNILLWAAASETGYPSPELTRQFFESIQLEETTTRNHIQFESKAGAFAIEFPSAPETARNPESYESDGLTHNFVSYPFVYTSPGSDLTMLVKYYDLPANQIINNDLEWIRKNHLIYAQKYGEPIAADTIQTNDYTAVFDSFLFKGTWLKIGSIARGNRRYILLFASSQRQKHEYLAPRFFNSFRFLPFQYDANFKRYQYDDFSIKSPIKFKIQDQDLESDYFPQVRQILYGAVDSLSGASYNLIIARSSPLREFSSIAAIKDYFFRLNAPEDNQIFSVARDTLFKGFPAFYSIYTHQQNASINYGIDFFAGMDFHQLFIISSEPIPIQKVWEYFSSFKFTTPKDPDALLKDKTPQVLQQLSSKEVSLFSEAFQSLPLHQYDASHLPAIHQLLEKDFPLDTLFSGNTKQQLLSILDTLYNEQTVDALETLFLNSEADPYLQAQVQEILSNIQTPASLALFFKLALNFQKENEIDNYGSPFQAFIDSAALANQYLDQLMSLRYNKAWRYQLFRDLSYMIKVEGFDKTALTPYIKDLIQIGETISNDLGLLGTDIVTNNEGEYWTLKNLNAFLGDLQPTPEIVGYHQKMLNIMHPGQRVEIIYNLLRSGQMVSDNNWTLLKDFPKYAYPLLIALESKELTNQIPAYFLRQEEIIKGYFSYHLQEEFGQLAPFQFIDQFPYDVQGEQVTMYVFTFKPSTLEHQLMGVCSQPNESTGYRIVPLTSSYLGKAYQPEKKEELLKELLEE